MTKLMGFMITLRYFTVICCFLVVSQNLHAVYDVHDFNGDEALEQRYRVLIDEIRCPKCQNQNVAGSNAPIAQDIRKKVFKLLLEGKDNGEILTYIVERYGDFAWYRPPVNSKTWLLWFIPPLLFLGVVLYWVAGALRKKKKSGVSGSAVSVSLSESELQQISEIDLALNEKNPPKTEGQ